MIGSGNGAARAALGVGLFTLALATATVHAAVTTTVVDVPTRGVTQRFLYVRPDAPVATIIALPGGDGVLGIMDDGTMPTQTGACNPYSRTKDALAARGYAVALVDQASDGQIRQYADIREVLRYVRNRDKVPTWITGGSSSTVASLYFAIDLPLDEPMGMISFSPAKINVSRIGLIQRPTLVVYHQLDTEAFPGLLYGALTSAPAKQVVGLSGGNDGGCGYHLFNGIEDQFVATVGGFIDTYNATLVPQTLPSSYQGLWWATPAGVEAGWGLNVAHQGDAIFATWFTYDTTGKEWWLSMTANKTSSNPDTYSGTLIQTHGPPFSAAPFDPSQVTRSEVGTATLTFADANIGSFAYSVNTASAFQAQALTQQNKAITRQVFGTLPTCVYLTQAFPSSTINYQDLWWAVPLPSESGWGLNLTHQGIAIFATWFTYDTDGSPLWLSGTLQQGAGQTFSGTLIQTAGPAFSTIPFDPNQVTRSEAGTATLTFQDGNNASFDYTAKGVTQHKAITRQFFSPPAGTVCR